MYITKLAQTRDCFIIRTDQITVPSRLVQPVDVVANVGNALDIVQKARMWPRHVSSHLVMETIASVVVDLQYRIEELEQGALSITSSAVLSPRPFSFAFIIKDPIGQTGRFHVHAPRQKGTNMVVEDLWMTSIIHALEQFSNVIHTLFEVRQTFHNGRIILALDCFHGCQHGANEWSRTRFHGIRDDEKPRFIFCPRCGMQCDQITRFREIDGSPATFVQWSPIPQVQRRVGCDGWDL